MNGVRKHVGHRETRSYKTSPKDLSVGYHAAIVVVGLEYVSEDVREGGARKDVDYRDATESKKLFMKIPNKTDINQNSKNSIKKMV